MIEKKVVAWLRKLIKEHGMEGTLTEVITDILENHEKRLRSLEMEQGEKIMIGTRRSHLGIIADILTVANKPSIQTRIIGKCVLSHAQFSSLISELIRKGLITTQQAKSTIVYLTTDRGRQFLKQYNMLLTLLKGDDYNDFFALFQN